MGAGPTDINHMPGEKLQQLILDTLKAPPELVARMQQILATGR